MPAAAKSAATVQLVFGEDEFAVKQRARQIYQDWTTELGGMDHEVIDAAVSNSGEALRVIGRLRESLNTLPFFGSGKVVWLQDCNFLGDERAASAQAVTAALGDLSQELREFTWQNVRLLISAGKIDKRKVFYKTLDKIGKVESFAGWSVDDRNWVEQASNRVREAVRDRQKTISSQALGELVSRVGPNTRQLDSEVEKLSLYVNDRPEITVDDVEAVCIRNKLARSFALGDALGNRNLPELLKRLDEDLWEIRAKIDRDKSVIGVLYGLLSKVRAMLLLHAMLREGWIKSDNDYNRFKAQLDQIPPEKLPADRRYNPLAINPYVLYKALPQVKQYTEAELVAAMDLLLKCNQRLVSSGLDETLVLQQTLVQIVSRPGVSK